MLNFILWLVFGAFIGFIANLIDPGKDVGGLLGNIIIGILGSIVGGFLAGLFGFEYSGGFNLWNIVFSVVGALLVLFIYKKVFRKA